MNFYNRINRKSNESDSIGLFLPWGRLLVHWLLRAAYINHKLMMLMSDAFDGDAKTLLTPVVILVGRKGSIQCLHVF